MKIGEIMSETLEVYFRKRVQMTFIILLDVRVVI